MAGDERRTINREHPIREPKSLLDPTPVGHPDACDRPVGAKQDARDRASIAAGSLKEGVGPDEQRSNRDQPRTERYLPGGGIHTGPTRSVSCRDYARIDAVRTESSEDAVSIRWRSRKAVYAAFSSAAWASSETRCPRRSIVRASSARTRLGGCIRDSSRTRIVIWRVSAPGAWAASRDGFCAISRMCRSTARRL